MIILMLASSCHHFNAFIFKISNLLVVKLLFFSIRMAESHTKILHDCNKSNLQINSLLTVIRDKLLFVKCFIVNALITDWEMRRKKRQSGAGSQPRRNGADGGNRGFVPGIYSGSLPFSLPPKPTKPPKPSRNSQCPTIPSEYRQELQRMIPPTFRPPKPPRPRLKRSVTVPRAFHITGVLDFIDEFTICE